MNLLGNALKFTKKGYVRLELQRRGANETDHEEQRISLVVEDTGKGISEEFLRHNIFTPFVQEDILAPGTGLGLHLTRQIIEDLHGSITVTSTVGQGTRFSIELPMKAAPLNNEVGKDDETRFEMREKMRDRTTAIVTTPLRGADEICNKGLSLVGDSLTQLFRDWFKMKVKRIERIEDADADLIVMTDDHFHDLLEAGGLERFIAHSTDDNLVHRLLVCEKPTCRDDRMADMCNQVLCYNIQFATRVAKKYTNIQFVTPP